MFFILSKVLEFSHHAIYHGVPAFFILGIIIKKPLWKKRFFWTAFGFVAILFE